MKRKPFVCILAALAAIAACLAYSAKWAYDRHGMLDQVQCCAQIYAPHYLGCMAYGYVLRDGDTELHLGPTDPPVLLWTVGEIGVAAIVFDGKPTDANLVSRAKALFPEAHVIVRPKRTDIYAPPAGAALSAD